MTLMLARFTIALALLPPALTAQDQLPGQPKFLLLATSRTGTMEKETQRGGSAGLPLLRHARGRDGLRRQ